MQDIPSRDSHLLSIANQEETVCPRQIKHSTSLEMVAGRKTYLRPKMIVNRMLIYVKN